MKIKIGLEKLFYICLAIFPCSFVVFFSIQYLRKWRFENYLFNAILFLIILVAFITIFFRLQIKIDRNTEIVMVLLLIASAFLYRVLIVDYVDAVPESDFRLAYENAKIWSKGYEYIERYVIYPYWGIWAYTMNLVFRLTGDNSVRTVQIFNCAICAATVPAIYGIVRIGLAQMREFVPYRKISFLAAAIYSFWPGISLYAGVLTNEHLANFFGAIAVLLLSVAYNMNFSEKSIKLVVIYIGAGIALGLMNWYKPISLILLASWIISIMFFVVIPILNNWNKKYVDDKNNLKKILLLMLLVIVCRSIVSSGSLKILASIMEVPQQSIATSMSWSSIYTGLDLEKNGKYSDSARKLKEKIFDKYGIEKSKDINQEYKELTIQRFFIEYKSYPKLFELKIEEAWGDESAFIASGWRRSLDLEEEKVHFFNNVYDYNRLPMYNSFGLYYLLVFIACILGAGFFVRYRNVYSIFICALTIFGFSLMGLLIEAQNRYKSVIYFAFPVIAGVGVYVLYILINKMIRFFNDIIVNKAKKLLLKIIR